ncbi:16636_t:CDS:1, partial [Funneliformis geosporum]
SDINSGLTFQHIFLIRSNSNNNSRLEPKKVIYGKLIGFSKKVVDIAIKVEQYYELSDILKSFLFELQNKVEQVQNDNVNVINPSIIAHKGCLPKRLKSSVKQVSYKAKHLLSSNIELNIINGSIEDTNVVKDHKCSKCKHLGHYAKTCMNLV